MMQFALVAAVMMIVALLFVLPTLLRKSTQVDVLSSVAVNVELLHDQLRELNHDIAAGTLDDKAYANSRQELEQRLGQQQDGAAVLVGDGKKVWLAASLAGAVLILSGILYQLLGTPAALDPAQLVPQSPELAQQQMILGMVQKLADKLKQQPDDAQGWNMLARSYFELGRVQEASDAYAHLTQLVPDNADYLASYALTMALTRNKNLQGEPDAMLQRALKLDPKNIRALSLSGSAAFDRHDYAAAINFWNQVIKQVPSDSEIARSTQNGINQAQSLQKSGETQSILMIPTPSGQ